MNRLVGRVSGRVADDLRGMASSISGWIFVQGRVGGRANHKRIESTERLMIKRKNCVRVGATAVI